MSSRAILRRPVRPADPIRVYYVLTAVSAFCFTLCFTVNLVHMIVDIGLTPLQLVLVGTVLEVTCLLFEVPTGVLADCYSRRLSVLVGFVLIGIGFVTGALPYFATILAAQVLWGIGSTFTSGAAVAWITDEVGDDVIARVFTREQQIQLVAAFAGTVCAGVMALIDIRLPLALSGVGFLSLAVWLALRMPERNFAPTPPARRQTVATMISTARAGLVLAKARPLVRAILLVSLLVGLASEAFDRLWQLHLLRTHALPGSIDPAVWFAGVALVGIAISLAVSLLANRRASAHLAALHPGAVLAALAGLQVIGVLGVALSPSLWLALVALWVKSAGTVLAAPVLASCLNRSVDSGVRATVLSLDEQANAIGQLVGGPPLGLLAGRTSVRVALLVAAGLLAPTVAVFATMTSSANRRATARSGRGGSRSLAGSADR